MGHRVHPVVNTAGDQIIPGDVADHADIGQKSSIKRVRSEHCHCS